MTPVTSIQWRDLSMTPSEGDPGARLELIERELTALTAQRDALREELQLADAGGPTALSLFHESIGVFVIAFAVTLLATPVMRRLAVANGVVDRPGEARKVHRIPIAYLGGVAVYLGLLAGIGFSYFAPMLLGWSMLEGHEVAQSPVPFSILAGATAIMLVGMIDDVVGIPPAYKIAGQLFAAALLAFNDIGVKVAAGLLRPVGSLLGNERLVWDFDLPFSLILIGDHVQFDLVYWAGTAIIAVFVLGACNASNLIDGLDGLLSGVTSIAMAGLLMVALALAVTNDGRLDAARITLCLAVLGACLGFLPHNFNPATIFLGDCGSLLLGFMTIVVILTLGDTGKTHLVIAGLVIYAIPIIDTTLAIIRRKMSGMSMSAPDKEHLHHQLTRAFGVKGAVFTLYAVALVFAALGVGISMERGRVIYAIALVIGSFIVVTAIKIARRARIEAEAVAHEERRAARAAAAAASKGQPGKEPTPV